MDAAAGCVRLPYSRRMDGATVVMLISGCTPAHHSPQFATGVAGGFLHGLENIRDRAHLAWRRAITQIGSIRILVLGVIAVHAHWHPALAMEITVREEPSGIEEEHYFAEPVVGKVNTPSLPDLFGDNLPARDLTQAVCNFLARPVIEEPEPRHRGVVHS